MEIDSIIDDVQLENACIKYPINTPKTKEALYYRNIFQELFPFKDELIPHYWMPQWQTSNINDPSATVLTCHEGEL